MIKVDSEVSVSVIVAYYNAPAYLERLLPLLVRQTYPRNKFEVLIVDDGSTEPAVDVIARYAGMTRDFAGFVTLTHEVNRGRAAARNSALRIARGRLIAIIDVDDCPADDYIESVVRVHANCSDLAVRPNIRILPELKVSSAFLRYRDARYLGTRAGVDYEDLPPRFFAASGSSLERTALLQAGGFDEGFVGYGGEDEELGIRLVRAGVRIVFRREVRMWDGDVRTTLTRTCQRYEDYGRSGAAHLFAKWPEYMRETRFGALEPTSRSARGWLISRCCRAGLARALERMLITVDGWRLPFDPPAALFQYVLISAYVRGVSTRLATNGELIPSGRRPGRP